MTLRFDAAVVGLGAHGSATAYHLASRGFKVIGFDRFSPPHELGSSSGETRIIREAYHEHPSYVPLVQRAYELWSLLEEQAGRTLYRQTRGLMLGSPRSATVSGARRSAKLHGIPHEMLDADQIRKRFPAYRPEPGTVALLEPRAGALFPEACIEAHLALAAQKGAQLRPNEPVLEWRARESGIRLRTSRGDYEAERLVLTAGAWLPELLRDPALPLRVERQVMHWFEVGARAELFRPDGFPIFIWEIEGSRTIYGFPDFGTGVKIGIHHEGETVEPDRVRRTVSDTEIAEVRRRVAPRFPDLGPPRAHKVCLYTNTPDEAFVVDRHPQHPNVIVASPCSGHGFKFASAIGEVVADLATKGTSRFDLSQFRLSRLLKGR